jgi:nonribosomal peptide synthetase DhbF
LSLDQVGTRDTFIDLGGHSLTTMRIISRVTQTFGVELAVKAFFESPTVAEMALIIERCQATRATIGQVECMVAELEAISEDGAERRFAGVATK